MDTPPTDLYRLAPGDRLFWCNSHQRRATYIGPHGHCCDPTLGGIMLPCQVVELTDIAEIEL